MVLYLATFDHATLSDGKTTRAGMGNIVKDLTECEKRQDWLKGLELIAALQLTLPALVDLLFELCGRGCLGLVALAERRLRGSAAQEPALFLLRAVSGLLLGDEQELAAGLNELRALSAEARSLLNEKADRTLVQPILDGFYTEQFEFVLKAGAIRAALDPGLDELVAGWREAPRLPIQLASRSLLARPEVAPSEWRPRVLIALRRNYFSYAWSRAHEMGPRLVAAMESAGWDVDFFGLEDNSDAAIPATYQQIIARAAELSPELIFLDEPRAIPDAVHLIALKEALPKVKLVGLYLDPWEQKTWAPIRAAGPYLDLLWTINPGLALWSEAELEPLMFFEPFPHGGEFTQKNGRQANRLVFVGGVHHYNWTRALWLTGAKNSGIPLVSQLSDHRNDDLPPLASYRLYMRKLEDAGCAINFSLRRDGSRMVTGRSFEALLSGALLVQEFCPEFDAYALPGRHYLSFSSPAELCGLWQFIRDCPKEAEAIRNAGYDFAKERYTDHAILGALLSCI
jgi:hypothetical protein